MPLRSAAIAEEAIRRPDGSWSIKGRRYSFKPPAFPAVLKPYLFISYQFDRNESPDTTHVTLYVFRSSSGEQQWEWQVPVRDAIVNSVRAAPVTVSLAERAELRVNRPERFSVDVCVNGVVVRTLPLTVHAPMPQAY